MEVAMLTRFRFAMSLVLLLVLAFAVPVFAGGWAVITLDQLPTGVVAGKSFTVGFMVRQHGRTPMSGLEPTITATLYKEEHIVINAEPDGKPGHYTATLTFPKEGEWQWSIQAFSMDQPMPVLKVAAPVAGSAGETAVKTEAVKSISLIWIVRALALGIGALGLLMAFQRKSRVALAATAFCLLVGVGSFVTGAGSGSKVEAQAESPAQAPEDEISQVESGRQLFVAKGCITCHVNRKIPNSTAFWTIDMGATDLSNFSANPEVLFLRLKDPASVKSDTQMPNLELRKEEIEALVAFINSK
jgi:hypothetical protein